MDQFLQNVSNQFDHLPKFMAAHLKLVVIALVVGVGVSVPVAVLVTRVKAMRYPTLTTAGVIQTVPSLALLALMVPIALLINGTLGLAITFMVNNIASFFTAEPLIAGPVELIPPLGFWPAAIALTFYSILPILRNTVTGISGVDPAMVEAARGVGMTDNQALFTVELPLAAPVIIAGIRTATVWVVGIATLATPIGAACLGNYIFQGLQTQNWTMVMFGVVFAAILAITLDALIGGLQKGAEQRRKGLAFTSGGLLTALVLIGLISPSLISWVGLKGAAPGQVVEHQVTGTPADVGTVRIGSKTFTEQYTLSRAIESLLNDAGYRTKTYKGLGSAVIFKQLVNNQLDVYVDYTGTIWANYMNRDGSAPPSVVNNAVTWWMGKKYGARDLGTLGFENAYALVMRRDKAKKLGIKTIGDLAKYDQDMKIGGDYEFFARPDWRSMRNAYQLGFSDEISYDSSVMYQAVTQGKVDVIAAFSSDGRISANNLVVLDDPKHVIPPYDAVLLLSPRVANAEMLINTLEPMIGHISLKQMQSANELVDIKGKSNREAANRILEAIKSGPGADQSSP